MNIHELHFTIAFKCEWNEFPFFDGYIIGLSKIIVFVRSELVGAVIEDTKYDLCAFDI